MIDEEAFPAAGIKSATSKNRLWRYGPVVVWAALIFIGSSSILSGSNTSAFLVQPMHWLFPTASDSTLLLAHLLIRKAGHLTEYAILAWLQPLLFGGRWIVDPARLPWWVAAATHLVFGWTIAILYPIARPQAPAQPR